MAYLPFYITPEEFEAHQERQAKEIASAPDAIEWQTTNLEDKNRWFRKGFSFCAPVLGFMVMLGFAYMGDRNIVSLDNDMFLVFLGLLPFLWFITFLSYGWDDRFNYIFSRKGLVYRRQLNQPDSLLNLNRFVAVIVAILCIILFVALGPGAFVGVGAVALISFGMMGKREVDVFKRVAEADDILYAQFNRKRKVVVLYHRFDDCYCSDNRTGLISRGLLRGDTYVFFNTTQELEQFIEKAKELFNIEVDEIENHKDVFDIKIWPKSILDMDVTWERYLPQDIATLKSQKA